MLTNKAGTKGAEEGGVSQACHTTRHTLHTTSCIPRVPDIGWQGKPLAQLVLSEAGASPSIPP